MAAIAVATNEDRKLNIRNILRDVLSETSLKDLLGDPTRGQVAVKLYTNWETFRRHEPIVETKCFDDLPYMLEAAMSRHGLEVANDWYALIGRTIVREAIDYILQAHFEEAEAIDKDIADEFGANSENVPDGDQYEERLIERSAA